MNKAKDQENKLQLSISIDAKLISWVDDKIRSKIFSSRSHAMERALFILKEQEEGR